MSVKRRPGTDLNHDNWDQEEEPEEQGEFQKASEEEIAKRTIKTAKRRVTNVDNDSANKPSSVFSSFAGFAKDNGKPGTLAFSFLSSSSNTNGDSSTEKPKPIIQSATKETTVGIMDDKQLAYYSKLKGLNQTVTEWIQKKVQESAFCILTPIFEDYAKHLKTITEESQKSRDADPVSIVASDKPATTEPAFTFAPLTSAPTILNKPSQDVAKTLFSFGTTEANKTPATLTTTIQPPTFSFGPSTTATASTGFSFGGPNAKPFTFANVAKPVDSSKPSDTNDTEENADEDQPPKYEFVPVVEKDSFYSKRCKVFVKGDKSYADRGVGMLYLKKVEGSAKTQLLVRADTSLGKILLNTLLSEGLPTQRMGNNNVMLICLPLRDAQGPTSVLIRVKNEEEADELLAEINKNKQ